MPGKQLNPQIQCHIINIDEPDEEEEENGTPQLRPDEEEHGRVSYRIDQGKLMIKASTKELSFPIFYKS